MMGLLLALDVTTVRCLIPSTTRGRHRFFRMLATDSRSLQRRDEFLRSQDGFKGQFTLKNVLPSSTSLLNPLLLARPALNNPPQTLPNITLTPEEQSLFSLLKQVTENKAPSTTLRVAGGWVRDKLLQTPSFSPPRSLPSGIYEPSHLSKHPSKGRKGTSILLSATTHPLDIDIALDDMLGREFADLLNLYLAERGEATVSVGTILRNPEKSKHLETATMKVGQFWIDFVNLRAEEYAGDSRIPELMRIGTAEEDALRRDLTINALFYNINTGEIEDLTGRGLYHLSRGVICTPLPPLTTLLDDPLRILRSVRFAARLRFSMSDELRGAARDERVRTALRQKVSRERIGGEVDLMFRSRDPVGAMRLIHNLDLTSVVFPVGEREFYERGLALLSTTHDYLVDCQRERPRWCERKVAEEGGEVVLIDDEEARRLLWYASFLKPLWDHTKGEKKDGNLSRRAGKKAHQSTIMKLMIDELKRPAKDAEAVEKIIKAADDFHHMVDFGGAQLSARTVLLNDIKIKGHKCSMMAENGVPVEVDCEMIQDPLWMQAMDYRLSCASIMSRVGGLWRAGMVLALSEQLASLNNGGEFDIAIEGDVIEQSHEEVRQGIITQHDAVAASIVQLGLVGIQHQKPLIDGRDIKQPHVLPNIPNGPIFRDVMDEQVKWMRKHPNGGKRALVRYLKGLYPEYCEKV